MVKDFPGFTSSRAYYLLNPFEGNQMVKFKIHEKDIELLKLHVDICLFFLVLFLQHFLIFVSV